MNKQVDIFGDGKYTVDEFGTVRKANGYVVPADMNHNGYLQVMLCLNGKQICAQVHRLVAKAFVCNPNGLPFVNHIDECRTNNHASNLEWCTPEQNSNSGTRNQRIGKRSVLWIDGKQYSSAAQAAKEIGVGTRGLQQAIKGKRQMRTHYIDYEKSVIGFYECKRQKYRFEEAVNE